MTDPARDAAEKIAAEFWPGESDTETREWTDQIADTIRTAFAEALRDAERLDWAETQLMWVQRHHDVLPETPVEIMHSGASGGGISAGYCSFGKDLRAAIDAARGRDE